MAVYNAAFEAYQKDPESFKLTKYLDTYEKIIGGNKVYVFSPNVDSDLSKYLIGYGSSPSKEEETLDMMKELSLEDE